MEIDEYQEICKRTAKPHKDPDREISNWALGLSGEAGDVVSCIKKVIFHDNKPIKGGIRENLGDMMWYTVMVCNFFDWKLSDILQENVDKLKERYPQGFGIKEAQRDSQKVDWNEEK